MCNKILFPVKRDSGKKRNVFSREALHEMLGWERSWQRILRIIKPSFIAEIYIFTVTMFLIVYFPTQSNYFSVRTRVAFVHSSWMLNVMQLFFSNAENVNINEIVGEM